MEKVTVPAIRAQKGKEKLTMLTAYDFVFANIMDNAGIDMILVGDSVGSVLLGYPNTIPVTIEDMIPPYKARRQGCKKGACCNRYAFHVIPGKY